MAKTTKKSAGKATGSAGAPVAVKKKTTSKKVAAKKKVVKKTVAKKAAATGAVAKPATRAQKVASAPAAAAKSGSAVRRISSAERHRMIAEAAYLRAESQGFLSDEHEDWVIAESEVDARLRKAKVEITG